jgi:hypothetical protein
MKIRSTSNYQVPGTLFLLHRISRTTLSDSDYHHSNFEDYYEGYDEDEYPDDEEDYDWLCINGIRVEDIEYMKDKERGIMLADKQVDDEVARLGCMVFQRKGYDRYTERASWTVRILLEEEANNNETTDEGNNNEATNKESYDALPSIEYYMYFLEVLERYMKHI